MHKASASGESSEVSVGAYTFEVATSDVTPSIRNFLLPQLSTLPARDGVVAARLVLRCAKLRPAQEGYIDGATLVGLPIGGRVETCGITTVVTTIRPSLWALLPKLRFRHPAAVWRSNDALLLKRYGVDFPLAAMLERFGYTIVHGAAAAVGSKAVVFLGPDGSGKTTTASMVAHKCSGSVLADNYVPLRRSRCLAFPGQPRLRMRNGFPQYETSNYVAEPRDSYEIVGAVLLGPNLGKDGSSSFTADPAHPMQDPYYRSLVQQLTKKGDAPAIDLISFPLTVPFDWRYDSVDTLIRRLGLG